MKKSTATLFALLILISAVVGIWLLASPALERQKNLERQADIIENIEKVIKNPVPKPHIPIIPAFDFEPESVSEPEQPKEPVAIGTELGILAYERLSIKLPVVEGVTEELLKTAVGHLPETAEIGVVGNAVITGHRSYTYGLYFNRLGEAEIDDTISYTSADGESCLFEVFEIIEIEPGDQIAFIQPTDESIITLYTCTPIYEATHRLLVRAKKI